MGEHAFRYVAGRCQHVRDVAREVARDVLIGPPWVDIIRPDGSMGITPWARISMRPSSLPAKGCVPRCARSGRICRASEPQIAPAQADGAIVAASSFIRSAWSERPVIAMTE